MKIFEVISYATGEETNGILLEIDDEQMTEEKFRSLCRKIHAELGDRLTIQQIAGELIARHCFKEYKIKISGRFYII